MVVQNAPPKDTPSSKLPESQDSEPATPTVVTERAPGEDPEEDAERDEIQNWKDAEGTPVPLRAVPAFEKAKELAAICREIDGMIRPPGVCGDDSCRARFHASFSSAAD